MFSVSIFSIGLMFTNLNNMMIWGISSEKPKHVWVELLGTIKCRTMNIKWVVPCNYDIVWNSHNTSLVNLSWDIKPPHAEVANEEASTALQPLAAGYPFHSTGHVGLKISDVGVATDDVLSADLHSGRLRSETMHACVTSAPPSAPSIQNSFPIDSFRCVCHHKQPRPRTRKQSTHYLRDIPGIPKGLFSPGRSCWSFQVSRRRKENAARNGGVE